MDFFINEILENDEVKKLLLSNPQTVLKGREIAEQMLQTKQFVPAKAGLLPVAVFAHLADFALEVNTKRGIDKEITVATLKDVNVWLDNYKAQHGQAGLKESTWLMHHYTGDLFRLGRLQFRLEKCLDGVPSGEVAIETHIPQGEPLQVEDCLASFDLAREFFKEKFPESKPQYFMCDSWLLNPNLEKVLDENSNIVKFMRLWNKMPFPADDSAQAIERVFGFGTKKEQLPDAPEKTLLQKRMKEYLLSGGEMNMCAGYIKI
ncbi:MAG: DUF5596 domain-containing protein [Clostridia bacterium]|nr:DUF5596 domain-containing protein [Clostridia bacterium]